MGNIISYFFPQPTPSIIEQVEEASEDDVSTSAVTNYTPERKTSELVFENEVEKAEKNVDEGFEVVEKNQQIVDNDPVDLEYEQEETITPELEEAPKPVTTIPEKSVFPESVETEAEQLDTVESDQAMVLEPEKLEMIEPEKAVVPEPKALETVEVEEGLVPKTEKQESMEPEKGTMTEPEILETLELEKPMVTETEELETLEPEKAVVIEPEESEKLEPGKAVVTDPEELETVELEKARVTEPEKLETHEPEKSEPVTSLVPEKASEDSPAEMKDCDKFEIINDLVEATPEIIKAITPDTVENIVPELNGSLATDLVKPEPLKLETPDIAPKAIEINTSTALLDTYEDDIERKIF